MSERSVQHGNFTIERRFAAPPAQVFAAWADPAARRIWGVPGGDWELVDPRFDFRVGGIETSRFGPAGDPIYRNETRYADIVPDRRIVFSYTIDRGETRISASLSTVELLSDGAGTRLIFTEQAAFLDGGDQPQFREAGWREILERLEAALRRRAAN
ncbi:SRPBCC family protein [Inquilinus limosus]|uniref:SRPBCC family protein n=1 Tax=Inquilinus limosus TaxID=171674 RepID=UPI003F19286E